MNIAEKPIAAIIGRLTSTGDGIHMIANSYRKGFRIHTHMHREAQLVYAAKGTMQVRWVPSWTMPRSVKTAANSSVIQPMSAASRPCSTR